NIEQALLHQVQHVQDASSASVPVVEGMDAFELMMAQGHFNERIRIEKRRIVHEALQPIHQDRNVLGRRRSVNGASRSVLENRARYLAESGLVGFQYALDFQDVVQGEQSGSGHEIEPGTQGLPVAE